MCEKETNVTIDMVAPVVARVEAAAREFEGKYTLNEDVYQKLLEVFRSLSELAEHSDDYVRFADVKNTELATLTAESDCFDFNREDLALFLDMLSLVDSFDAITTEDCSARISFGMRGLWKAVIR